MMEIAPKLFPVFWGALAAMGVSGIVFLASLTLMLGSQLPLVLRVVWISASVLVAASAAFVLILVNQ